MGLKLFWLRHRARLLGLINCGVSTAHLPDNHFFCRAAMPSSDTPCHRQAVADLPSLVLSYLQFVAKEHLDALPQVAPPVLFGSRRLSVVDLYAWLAGA